MGSCLQELVGFVFFLYGKGGGKSHFSHKKKLPWEPFRAGINSSVCWGLRGARALLGSLVNKLSAAVLGFGLPGAKSQPGQKAKTKAGWDLKEKSL